MPHVIRSIAPPGLSRGVFLLACLALTAGAMGAAAQVPNRPAPENPGQLFDGTAVWTIHLTFSDEQWTAMEPKGGTSGLALMLGGGGDGIRRPAFAFSTLLAPVFLRDGDADADGKLSRDELRGLGEKWFDAWDKAQAGKMNARQLRAGLNATLEPPPDAAGNRLNRGMINLQGAEGKRNGLASAVGVEFEYVHADLEFQGRAFKDVGVRYKGNGTFLMSRGSLKRSLKIDLNRWAGTRSLGGASSLNLHNCVADASWMNEVVSHRLYRDAGVPAARSAYARVYVTVAGKYNRMYFGLYSLVEDVGRTFAQDRFGTDDGALFKPVTPDLFTDLGDDWSRYNQTYDPKTKLSDGQKRRVIDFARLVSRAGDDEFAAKLADYLDLEAFARYMAVTVYLSTLDSILAVGQNYYLYLEPKANTFQFIPWDLDHSFGTFHLLGNQEQREQLSIRKPWMGDNRFLSRVFKVEAFRKLYLARVEEFSGSLFKPERFHRQVEEIGAVIREAVREESASKLALLDKAVAGDPVQAGSGFSFMRPPPVKPIKPFVTARWKSVNEQSAGKSEGKTIEAAGLGGGRPGGPELGTLLGPPLLAALDADKDGSLTREETAAGFAKWFDTWTAGQSGVLTEAQLRTGLDRALAPSRGSPTTTTAPAPR